MKTKELNNENNDVRAKGLQLVELNGMIRTICY